MDNQKKGKIGQMTHRTMSKYDKEQIQQRRNTTDKQDNGQIEEKGQITNRTKRTMDNARKIQTRKYIEQF